MIEIASNKKIKKLKKHLENVSSYFCIITCSTNCEIIVLNQQFSGNFWPEI